MIRKPVSAALLAVLLWFFGAEPIRSHFDAPGPPPIRATLDVDQVIVLTGEDDGYDFDSEILLYVEFEHANHNGVMATSFDIDDLDTPAIWLIPNNIKNIWTHDECTPRESIIVSSVITELDNSSKDVVKLGLFGIGRIGLAAFLGGPVGLGLAAASSLISIIVVGVNGHDNLGFGSASMPLNATAVVNHTGPDGSALVNFTASTTPLTDTGQCGTSAPPDPLPTPEEAADQVYQPLKDAAERLLGILAEPGNPAELSPAQLDDVRDTFKSWLVRTGEMVAGAAVEDSRGFVGVQSAITNFQNGQSQAAAGNAQGALDFFRDAYVDALNALRNGNSGPDTPLPRQIAVTPDFYSTVQGRGFSLVALGLGSGGPVNLFILDAPPGLTTQVVQPDASIPVFELRFETEGVAPGTYPMRIVGDDGMSTLQPKTFTLVVNPIDPGPDIQEDGFSEFAFGPGAGAKGLEPSPGGVWGDYVYVADSAAGALERIDATDQVELIGTGFDFPVGMSFLSPPSSRGATVFEDGLYVAEFSGNRISRVDPSGNATTFAAFPAPGDVAFDPSGAYGSDLFATTAFTGPISTIDATGASTFFSGVAATYLDFGPGGSWGGELYSTALGGAGLTTFTVPANAPIPDSTAVNEPGPPLTIPVFFPESRIIADLDVGIVATHPSIGDLNISVEHPDGTTVTLWNQDCNDALYSGLDNQFDDEGTAQSCNPNGPTPDPADGNGNLPPRAGMLSAFDGKDALGQWTLHVTDHMPGNTGTLDEWSLRITQSNTGIARVFSDGSFEMVSRGFQNPEGFDWAEGPGWNGDMFATDNATGEIWRIRPDGMRSLFARLPGAADVAFWNCALYVVSADGGCWRVTSDADDLDEDGRAGSCDNCPSAANFDQGTAVFGQEILATGPGTFSWPVATDVIYARGALSSMASYTVDLVQSVSGGTSFSDATIPAGGFFYIVKPDCPVASWQTERGSEPARDEQLP